MLVLQNNAPVGFELEGLTTGLEPVATAGAKFDLSVNFAEQRGADGAPAGISGNLEYATDLFDRATVEALAGRSRPAAGGSGCGRGPADRHARRSQRRRAAHHPARLERHRAHGAISHSAGAVRGAGGEDTRCDRCRVRGREPHLPRARRTRQSARASSARARRRTRSGGGAVRGALAGDAHRPPRHPQGRRRLSAARSGLPARAARLHARRLARAAAADPVRVHRSTADQGRPRRAPRYRLADDRGAADHRTGIRPRSTTPRLRHLHVGVHRHAEGRLGRSCLDPQLYRLGSSDLRVERRRRSANSQCTGVRCDRHRALPALVLRQARHAPARARPIRDACKQPRDLRRFQPPQAYAVSPRHSEPHRTHRAPIRIDPLHCGRRRKRDRCASGSVAPAHPSNQDHHSLRSD